jgi:glycosyltransferase involved in cell wall biosynthesis
VRVLIVAQYYAPEPVPKPSDIAEELTRRGHFVTVLTGLPNYPSGVLAAGYKLRPRFTEVIGGVPVTRVFEFPYHGRSAIGRTANYLSFTLAAALAAYAVPRPDVMYVFIPPPTLGVSAWVIGALRRAPFVCDVQDIWPDEAIMSGILREGVFSSILRAVERFVYAKASHVLVATDGARTNLLKKGVPETKVSVLPHWQPMNNDPEEHQEEFVARGRRELRASDHFVVTFAGNLGILQGLSTVLDAAERLRSRREIAFRFIGDGLDRPRLEGIVAERSLDNVLFLDRRPSADVAPLLAASDCLLVHAVPGPLQEIALPTKTLAYLAAGRPVIAAMDGPTAAIIREAGAGVTTPPGDPVALADAIDRLSTLPPAELAAMGARGRRFVAERFDKRKIIDRLETILERHAQRD